MIKVADVLNHWSKSYIGWVTMLDDKLQPEQWTGTPGYTFVTQNSEDRDDYILAPTYYMLGQFSSFVKRGAYRIDAQINQDKDNIVSVCFVNPDNSVVLVLINRAEDEQDVSVSLGDRGFAMKLPAQIIATFQVSPK